MGCSCHYPIQNPSLTKAHPTRCQDLSASSSSITYQLCTLSPCSSAKVLCNESWGHIYRDDVIVHLLWPLIYPHESSTSSQFSHAYWLVHARFMLTVLSCLLGFLFPILLLNRRDLHDLLHHLLLCLAFIQSSSIVVFLILPTSFRSLSGSSFDLVETLVV